MKINRRGFLKALGIGALSTTAVVSGCSTKGTGNDNVPVGKLTYRTNHNTGDKVSLIGYGCMRLPTIESNTKETEDQDIVIDQKMVNTLVDYAIAHGVNYFDTSPRYLQGKSEPAMGIALSRHPRNKYMVATKMSNFIDGDDESAATAEASKEMYYNSFKNLKVKCLDYYLLHSIGESMDDFNKRFINNGMLDFLLKEREAGRIRNLGWSFHGIQEVFDYVINMPVKWDFIQIQLNYIDWKHATEGNVNADYLYGELTKRNIPAVIMEPIRGGRLARMEYHELAKLKRLRPDDTAAAWAFRYAGSFPNVLTVLSGMTYMENLQENITTYSPLQPLTDQERKVLAEVTEKVNEFPYIPCTGCQYCMPCKYGLDIPGIFGQYNKCLDEGNYPEDTKSPDYRKERRAFLVGMDRKVARNRQPDHCVGCGACVPKCPQNIQIPDKMQEIDIFMNDLRNKQS